jgi:hypothetical protein
MDVEEIKAKETSLKKKFIQKQDPKYTSAHMKAARRILASFKRLIHRR